MKLKTNHEAHSSDKTSKEIVREIIIAKLKHKKNKNNRQSKVVEISQTENANFQFLNFPRNSNFHYFLVIFNRFRKIKKKIVKVCYHSNFILTDL